MNWDPELATAISDLEIENREEHGHLWHFRYPLDNGVKTRDGKDYLVVATTRPETMLGDTAVAVHPDDERYQNLIGQTLTLPLVGRQLRIIADDQVDRAFGTGCVKITPAHDFNDHAMGTRHNLPLVNIFTATANINDNAPPAYRNLDRFEARRRIVADLDQLGLLDKVEKHRLSVPRGDRSEAIIEPWLTDQWFVKIAPLAEPAVAAVRNGAIEFVPNQYANLYFAWMRDIEDWCISRQLWWGHRIPAWYDADGNILVGRNEAEARRKGNLDDNIALRQDEDVLDTWFSSALWTFATLGWPEKTADLKRFHPTDVLVTGHDIIFFWVTRMIMMTLKFTGEVPFRKVYIHGLVRDAKGQKMSKTKGNGLDPLDLIDGIGLEELVKKRTENLTQPHMAAGIEKDTRRDFPNGIASFGTDALRLTFCALASTGRDVRFDLKRTEGYRNFCNKLWNAARFVLMNTDAQALDSPRELGLAERWILARGKRLVDDCHITLGGFRFDLYANALHEFAWHEYCDWYLEFAKPLLWDTNADPRRQSGARHTLLRTLELLLRTAHPILPFITEAIWRDLAPLVGKTGPSIMLQPFPQSDELPADAEAEAAIDWLKGVVTALRTMRGEAGIKPGREIEVLLQGGDAQDRTLAQATLTLLQRMAKVRKIDWLAPDAQPPANALALVGDLKVMVPLAGLIDITAERTRISREIKRRTAELKHIETKLGNAQFVQNAPAAVVAKERRRASETRAALATLEAQRRSLG